MVYLFIYWPNDLTLNKIKISMDIELIIPGPSHIFWFLWKSVFAGCLDTLAAMQELKIGVACSEEETQSVMKVYSKEDYSVVNRFESKNTVLVL